MNVSKKLLRELPEQTETYTHTRFNIEAGYKWGAGMPPDKMNDFFDEIKNLFSAAGWSINEGISPSIAPTVTYGSSSLYCHPMELSGPCEEKLYPVISAILEQASTCILLNIEKLGPVYKVTDQEYEQALSALRKDIEKDLLEAFQTPHPTKFLPGYYDKLTTVAEQYRIPTLKSYIGISSNDIHIKYTTQVFSDMLRNGKICCKEDAHGHKTYRSLTSSERLEQARKEAADGHSSQINPNPQHEKQSQRL